MITSLYQATAPRRRLILIICTTTFLLSSAYVFRYHPSTFTFPSRQADVSIHSESISSLPGALYRDSRPIATAQRFLALAESEVASRRLDTCNGKLGSELVKAYVSSSLEYCSPTMPGDSKVTCFPVRGSDHSKWWPYPAAYCTSNGLKPSSGYRDHTYFEGQCRLTKEGAKLKGDMGHEAFAGKNLVHVPNLKADTARKLNRTLILIGRQDQWNPVRRI